MTLTDFPAQALAALLALVAHQVFRRHELYSIPAHLFLLFGPPVILAARYSRPFCLVSFSSTVISCLATYLLTLTLSVIAYRVSPVHPLANYPGPLTHRISKIWMACVCFPGHQHEHIKALHDRYGDVVRIGPNELSIRDPSVVPALLGPAGLRKGPHYLGRLLSSKIQTMIALRDTDVHLHRRRPWTRGFTSTALKEYEDQVAVRVKQLVTRLEEQRGVVELGQWINYFAYDIMSDIAFGGGSELMSGHGTRNFWSVLEDALSFATFLGHMPWLGDYVSLLPPVARPVHEVIRHCGELVQKRIARGSAKKDLFHYLNNEDEIGRDPPPLCELVDDGVLAVVAGADTVASTLSSLFACLITHPEAYEKLQTEIDHFYTNGGDIFDTRHHRDMPYLTAVINETLRLFPAVPGCTQREEPHDGLGTTVGFIHVPPGTAVWVHCYSMQRDPRNFSPAPDAFWPDRWLVASGELSQDDPSLVYPGAEGPSTVAADPRLEGKPTRFVHNEAAFIPFSYGPMNCAGKSFAWAEMRTVVCALLRRYRLRAGLECWDLRAYQREFRDYFVTTRGKVPVWLEVRNAI